MYQIHCLNKISPVGTSRFGDQYTVGAELAQADAVLVRSAAMHDMELPEQLLAIARAGAGVNNIPIDKCSEQGIVVFNTPGANANAVKEMVICGLLLASRKVAKAIDWAKSLKGEGEQVGKLVEKGKSVFVGPEITGKSLGVIGLGAIGILVANAAEALGMEVFGYDPYLSVDTAWGLSSNVRHARSLDEIYANCDYITLHLPQTPDTKGMINADSLAKMKDGVRILNFARGGLVKSADLIAALESEKVASYVTDFPDDDLLCVEGVTAIPHLGASTPESEDNCARMAVDQVKDYLENGNIRNSVNLPAVSMAREPGMTRICILHRNVPNTISVFSGAVGDAGVNIENMQSMSRGNYAYTMFDVSGDLSDDAVAGLEALDAIIRVRIIR